MLEMVAEKGRSGEPALELSNTVRTVFGVYAAFASGERLSAVSRAEVNVGEDGASANCAGDGILENVLLARFVTISSSQQAGDSCRDEERAAIRRLVVSGWIDTAIGRRGMLYRVVRCKLVQ